MKTRKPGFAIIIVIVAIAVLGIEIAALSSVAKIGVSETNRDYLEACNRNVFLSAAAYVGTPGQQIGAKELTLDVTLIHPQATCTVRRTGRANNPDSFEIKTTCQRRNAKITRRYRLDN